MGSLPEHEYTDAELEQMHKRTCFGCVSCLREENTRLQEQLRVAQYGYESNTQLAAEGNIVIMRLETERDGYKALAERRKEALRVLEWLPEDDGDWAECPCCGALRMNGHIPDGCQLSAAIAAEALEEKP